MQDQGTSNRSQKIQRSYVLSFHFICSICFSGALRLTLFSVFDLRILFLPAKESSLLRAEPVCCCCRDLPGAANRISWWITGLQMNFGLLSCLLSECDMKNIEKQYVELLEGKGGGERA